MPFTGSPITNSVLNTGMSAGWTNLPIGGQEIKELISKFPYHIRYKWRVRVEYALNKRIDGQRFSRWFYGYAMGLGDIGVLPVELTLFNGNASGPVNQLYWSTATENEQCTFRGGAKQRWLGFFGLGSVDAAGESFLETTTRSPMPSPRPAWRFYRLRIEDIDGSSDRSQTISIVRGIGQATLFPKPRRRK
jgi:hypothetical protein